MNNSVRKCRKCGKEIGIIGRGIYRNTIVDLTPVTVTPDENGDTFVRIDGSKLRGREVPWDGGEPYEPAYRMHRKTCGGRK